MEMLQAEKNVFISGNSTLGLALVFSPSLIYFLL